MQEVAHHLAGGVSSAFEIVRLFPQLAPIEQRLSYMISRFPVGAARVSRRPLQSTAISLVVGWLILASAGCFHRAAKPILSGSAAEQEMSARAQQEAAVRGEANLPREELQEHCNQLATATPGVEELRNNNGSIESRQWTLVLNGSAPRWAFVRTKDEALDGWAPKPGIGKLDFRPPIEPVLTAGSKHFLAYVPAEPYSLENSQKSATVREVFGAAQGTFTWRGRKYSYTLAPELPCFSHLQ